jgi:peptide deformylase
MVGPVERLELITDPKVLARKAHKIGKWAGLRVGDKLMKFVVYKGLDCVGLAAPQIGIEKRVFVMFDKKDFAVFVNPRIVEIGPMQAEDIEGCLSIPGRKFKVVRPTSIVVKDAIRTNPVELTDWSARVWLHELDHLNGVLICNIGTEVTDGALIHTC